MRPRLARVAWGRAAADERALDRLLGGGAHVVKLGEGSLDFVQLAACVVEAVEQVGEGRPRGGLAPIGGEEGGAKLDDDARLLEQRVSALGELGELGRLLDRTHQLAGRQVLVAPRLGGGVLGGAAAAHLRLDRALEGHALLTVLDLRRHHLVGLGSLARRGGLDRVDRFGRLQHRVEHRPRGRAARAPLGRNQSRAERRDQRGFGAERLAGGRDGGEGVELDQARLEPVE
mmetsp:Transcript_87578/g.263291  ORF Transcript_87578/g.263291 Transcript_87578/m.263291 type:complete len:231 (+) Transcript_87578:304-996(+)